MKKLMIAAVIVCAAVAAQAATSRDFELGDYIDSTDGKGLWTGTATITCEALDYTENISVDNGYLAATRSISAGDPTQAYTFTLSMTDGDYTYSQTTSG